MAKVRTNMNGLPAFERKLINAVDKGINLEAERLASDVTRSMPGKGASAISVKGERLQYTPSNPGEPPGVRTNRLKGSIRAARIGFMRWAVGTNVKYGRRHELGDSKTPARPFLRPALNKARRGMVRRVSRAAARLVGGR